MSGIIKGVEILGVPMTIVVVLVGMLLILNIIGEILSFKGKVVPEIINIRKYFKRKSEEKKKHKQLIEDVQVALKEMQTHYNPASIAKRDTWMHEVDDSIKNNDSFIYQLDKKVDEILETNKTLTAQLEQVKSNVLENEADRLRSELFDCGNRCRRHIRLHPEEMEHIRAVYQKYSKVLHQNGPGEKEFNFITDYYNKQDFPDYHKKND